MTLFTVKDLKKCHEELGKEHQRHFRDAIIREYREYRKYDIFLAHTGIPLSLIHALALMIEEMGFSLFVDPYNIHGVKLDTTMREHVQHLKKKMPHCDCLLIAAQAHDEVSSLISWLLGFYESLNKKVAVIPIFEKDINTIDFAGKGFLEMYPYIGVAKAVQDNRKTLWVMKNRKEYINIEYWMAVDYMKWEKD